MFKKFIISVVIGTMSMSAFSAQDIYLTFKDGRGAVYKNLPDSIDNAQFATMLMRDYGKDFNTDIDHSKSRVVDVLDAPVKSEVQTGFWDSGWGTAAKVVLTIVVLGAVAKAIPAVSAGCQHYYDRAKDGSLCGKRSADYRPGGK